MIKKFILVICFLFSLTLLGEEIMWWMVDDTATVDNQDIITFLQPYPEDENHWCAARVKITGKDIGTIYLDIESPDFPGERFNGAEGAWLGDSGSGYWGTGNWANQSPLDGFTKEIWNEALFQMEIGYLSFNEVLDVVDWSTLAETDPIAKNLLSQHLYERGTLMPPDYSQWTPTDFHTVNVPEPSSNLLFLVGLSILMLRRKRV